MKQIIKIYKNIFIILTNFLTILTMKGYLNAHYINKSPCNFGGNLMIANHMKAHLMAIINSKSTINTVRKDNLFKIS